MDPHRESRKRLRPWLEKMINQEKCPGLVWHNRNIRSFRIPWRHFNNKDWASCDSQVFKEWAIFTGKFQEGEESNYPVWKTRLRCALKKIPEIRELQNEHKLEEPNPFRVYQFVDPPLLSRTGSEYEGESISSSVSTYSTPLPYGGIDFLDDSSASSQPNIFEKNATSQTQLSNVPTVVYDDFNNVQAYNNLTKNEIVHFLGPNITSPELNLAGMDIKISQEFPDLATTYECEEMTASLPSDLRSVKTEDLLPIDQNTSPYLISPSTTAQLADPRFQKPCSFDFLNSKVTHSMQLSVFYFSHEMLNIMVDEKGCRLFHEEIHVSLKGTVIEEPMYGPKHVHQVQLPKINQHQKFNEKSESFAKEMLDGMERGLVLTMKEGDIYAKRLCRTRVFVFDSMSQSRLLNRSGDAPTKVFDFNGAFRESYDKHISGSARIPNPFFYLIIGQEARSDSYNPLNRLLIYVQVKHTEAAKLCSQLSDESRLIEPLMSSFDTHDCLLDKFKQMFIKSSHET